MAGAQQIIALGGGGFSMEDNTALDQFVLDAARSARPRICFIPTASGDSDNYVVRFYKRFTTLPCEPTHLELALRTAASGGTVLAGISAGSLCWFDAGVTDSFGSKLAPIAGLGLLGGSNCPFYDGTAERRSTYHRFIRDGMPSGIATDIGVALHFVDGTLKRVVSSRRNAKAYRVGLGADELDETVIEPEYLGA